MQKLPDVQKSLRMHSRVYCLTATTDTSHITLRAAYLPLLYCCQFQLLI